jgi:serine protease Do
MSGMTWMFLGLLIFFIAAAVFTAIVTPIRRGGGVAVITRPSVPRAYVGVDAFDTVEGGVSFSNVEPPGSPADAAGLVGGDIITTFDGQTITSDDQIMEMLGQMPIGRTVDVVYLRDGETKNTKLTTISREEYSRLEKAFNTRPEGKGRFGFDDDSTERVPIPGTRKFGIRLDDISQSLPADLAGIKAGDIVIEFDGVPIRTPEELAARVNRAIPYSTIDVLLLRGTEQLTIPVKMGKR